MSTSSDAAQHEEDVPKKLGASATEKAIRDVFLAGGILTAGMVVVSIVLAISGPPEQGAQLGVGLTAFLIYTASITVGTFLGFLFGLPRGRAVDQLASQQGTEQPTGEKKPRRSGTNYLANSNLIKVSDWLTTIIIGLTLVNLGAVLPAAREFGEALSAPLGGYPYSSAVGLAVGVGSLVAGFILGWLWTSSGVRMMLEIAEREASEVYLPDVVNEPVEGARELLAAQGLNLTVRAGNSGSTIVRQWPKPGTRVTPDQPIYVETR